MRSRQGPRGPSLDRDPLAVQAAQAEAGEQLVAGELRRLVFESASLTTLGRTFRVLDFAAP